PQFQPARAGAWLEPGAVARARASVAYGGTQAKRARGAPGDPADYADTADRSYGGGRVGRAAAGSCGSPRRAPLPHTAGAARARRDAASRSRVARRIVARSFRRATTAARRGAVRDEAESIRGRSAGRVRTGVKEESRWPKRS